jgi:hypothetical protein
VANGTGGGVTAPLGDKSNYLWGTNGENGFKMGSLTSGATVVFATKLPPMSFNFYWGSIDAVTGDGFNNTLTVQFLGGVFSIITGAQLVQATKAANWATPVKGMGAATANDNQWFNITGAGVLANIPIVAFNASSTQKAFEFDMAAPEPSTWLMALLGFAGLGYAGFRKGRRRAASAPTP